MPVKFYKHLQGEKFSLTKWKKRFAAKSAQNNQ